MTAQTDPAPPAGRILEDTVVPARAPWSGRLAAGERLRLIDLEGQQAVDFLCFNAADPAERYHAANTVKVPCNIYLGAGSVLRSSLARPMMTIVEDTCGGHDTIFGCCSFEVDRVRYGKTNAECCQRNFEREMARHGIGPEHVVANVNFFMSVPVAADGSAQIVASRSRPGDYVDLRAEMDLIAVLSNCPEALNPATGAGGPTPIRVVRYVAG
ncbi:MAG: urea carboxylase-associated family protein [Rhodospirillales bacterium]|nr:urea carboxylase-associated family protein [Rhodospirillales bacterium]